MSVSSDHKAKHMKMKMTSRKWCVKCSRQDKCCWQVTQPKSHWHPMMYNWWTQHAIV